MPEIYSIVFKPSDAPQVDPEDAYTRVPTSEVTLMAGYGIKGDRKGGNPKRHLNIMCYETLQTLGSEGFHVQPGQMGEQIIIKGLDLVELSPGTQVQFGTQARIEVLEPRNGCDRFERIQGKAPSLAKRRLGVMARVIEDGVIRVGDSVQVI